MKEFIFHIFLDEQFLVPKKEKKDSFVHTVFDGMVFDISSYLNVSLDSYADHENFCESKKGNLVSIDNQAKLDVLISLIQDHNSAGKLPRANYLIGTK